MSMAINGLLVVLIGWLVMRRMMPVKGVQVITTDELKAELKNKQVQFVDVRTSGEFRGNHIKGFQNIPLHELGQKAEKLSKEKGVVVICQSGMRSTQASKLLKKLGFVNIKNVKGGMSAWN